jgi:hypothetical protein
VFCHPHWSRFTCGRPCACSPDPPRFDCARLRMTFIDDMRARLLEPKRTLGNIRKSVGVISDAIGCNLDDGTCRLARRRQLQFCSQRALNNLDERAALPGSA